MELFVQCLHPIFEDFTQHSSFVIHTVVHWQRYHMFEASRILILARSVILSKPFMLAQTAAVIHSWFFPPWHEWFLKASVLSGVIRKKVQFCPCYKCPLYRNIFSRNVFCHSDVMSMVTDALSRAKHLKTLPCLCVWWSSQPVELKFSMTKCVGKCLSMGH